MGVEKGVRGNGGRRPALWTEKRDSFKSNTQKLRAFEVDATALRALALADKQYGN